MKKKVDYCDKDGFMFMGNNVFRIEDIRAISKRDDISMDICLFGLNMSFGYKTKKERDGVFNQLVEAWRKYKIAQRREYEGHIQFHKDMLKVQKLALKSCKNQ